MLLCGILLYWSLWRIWLLETALGHALGLPDEVLDEVAIVLVEKHDLGLLDQVAIAAVGRCCDLELFVLVDVCVVEVAR